jgi:hypothetical protein
MGGCIAIKNENVIIWITSMGGNPYRTANGGTSWSLISIAGVGDGDGWHDNYPLRRHTATFDDNGDLYMYNSGTQPGVYKSTNDGVDCTRVYASALDSGGDEFNAKLKAIPGHAGHLLFTAGDADPLSLTPGDGSLWRSTNAAVSFAAVPNLKEIYDFGFGAAGPGGYDPTVFVVGFVDDGGGYEWGVWYSTDFDQATPTWTKLGDFPVDTTDKPIWIAGDPDTFKHCYIALAGSGWVYYGTA